MTFALYPYGSRTQVMWSEFRAEQGIDTLCLGSSIGAHSYDPDVFDRELGSKSFNMCTDSQLVVESHLGLREALESNDVKRVFYAVDFGMLWDDRGMYPGREFLREKGKGETPFEWLSDLTFALRGWSWMNTEQSINWLFPWIELRVGTNMVRENIAMQLDGTPLVKAQEVSCEKNGYPLIYRCRGYSNYDGVCDFNADRQTLYSDANMRPLNEENLKDLAALCDLCASRGIEFIAYIPPKTDFGLIDMRDYYDEFTRQVKSTVVEHGGSYYDFNLAKPEVFEAEESYYWDWEHLNTTGCAAFSEAFARFLQARDAGADVDSLFMTYEEKLASMDTISLVVLEDHPTPEGIKLKASCLAGPNVKPEYQFLVERPDGSFEVIQDYSPEGECLYVPEGRGVVTVRVNARQQGSDAEFEKHTQHRVTNTHGRHGGPERGER